MAEANSFEVQHNRSDGKPAGVELAFVTDNVQNGYGKAIAAGASVAKPSEE